MLKIQGSNLEWQEAHYTWPYSTEKNPLKEQGHSIWSIWSNIWCILENIVQKEWVSSLLFKFFIDSGLIREGLNKNDRAWAKTQLKVSTRSNLWTKEWK